MEAATLSEARVYVGTYGKYNNGSLFGAWLDLSDYSDKEDFYEACRELHKDEEDAEYMFQDWENVPENLIGESWISENFFTLRDAVEKLSDTEQEAFFVWCNYKVSIRPTTGIKPLYTTIATVTMNLIVSAAIVECLR